MEQCIVSLSSTLLDMLKLVTGVSLKELQLYERLRLLRTLLKRQPDRFDDDDKMQDITAATVCDAGVRIFSLFRKDLVIDHGRQCFQDNSEVIWEKALEERVVGTLRIKFSKTTVLGFIDFLLEDYMMELNSSKFDSNTLSSVSKIRDHLFFLKSFLGKLVELRKQQENLHQDVWNLSVEVTYKIEFLIDQLVLGDILDSFTMSLQSITQDIIILKADSLNIFNDEERREIFNAQQITWPSVDKVRPITSNLVVDEVVGFESEQASIVNRLMRGMKKLQVVAVIGMAGSGKTTLATKVFTDLSITHHFHVKAWCSISQVFDRRKVLLELLNRTIPKIYDKYLTMNADDLSQELWRSLKKQRYLIFFDDIWNIEAFNLLKGSLPDDSYQSRILLTSRNDVFPKALLDEKPLFLRQLIVDESLVLLQRKLFPAQKDWPPALNELGIEIAEYCKGLPLTVVIIAGLLNSTQEESWKDVLKTLRSSITFDVTNQCESTLELSYKHLPDHLKPCFLWFGAYPEDYVFSVKKLIWLWIAEGFIRKSESKSLEDVARDYLNNLIGRSLVMNFQERATGGVKLCRIHDLLHDFCLRKANEDNFMHLLKVEDNGDQEHLSSDDFEALSFVEPKHSSSDGPDNPRRLCIHSEPRHLLNHKYFFHCLRSLIFISPIEWDRDPDLSFIFRIFKLLRVLDMEQVYFEEFPNDVHLRYLAIKIPGNVCPTIGKLSNLETLVLNPKGGGVINLPDTLWNLRKLRHLYSKYGSIELPIDDQESPCNLLELEVVSTLYVSDFGVMEKQMRKFPNIRQMKCMISGDEDGSVSDSKIMDFSFLSQLESLSLSGYCYATKLVFPEKMKKLTLGGIRIPWNKIASIANLPNLEALKLSCGSFLEDTWHVEEGEFPKLKFLKFEHSDLVNWTAASEYLFPNLERLVLNQCNFLKKIPECLDNVATLELIEVIDCPDHVVSLLKKVEEFQKEMGNSVLQFHERTYWRVFICFRDGQAVSLHSHIISPSESWQRRRSLQMEVGKGRLSPVENDVVPKLLETHNFTKRLLETQRSCT